MKSSRHVGVNPRVDVSVIIAVRNGGTTITQCIESVLAQQGCSIQLIVVDALSDDGTADIVMAYGVDVDVSIRERDSGISEAWNKALRVADGEWSAFMGADDFYLNTMALHSLLQAARQSVVSPVVVYGGIVRSGGSEEYVVHPRPDDEVKHLRRGRMLPHQGSLSRTATLRELGGFDVSLAITGDHDMFFRLLASGPAVRCDQVVAVMRIGGISSDWHQQRRRHAERLKILRRELSPTLAIVRTAVPLVLEIAGNAIERLMVGLLGHKFGSRATLALRRSIGRAPRLNRAG